MEKLYNCLDFETSETSKNNMLRGLKSINNIPIIWSNKAYIASDQSTGIIW